MGCLICFTFIERGSVGVFYLMGLACKKKGGSGCQIGILLMGMTIT